MDFLTILNHHIMDHDIVSLFTVFGIKFAITKHLIMMWIAGLLMIVIFAIASRQKGIIPYGIKNCVEVFIVFMRNDIVLPSMGTNGNKQLPYFLTLFFFILFCNLLGMVPGGATATGNISVTAALAISTFFFMIAGGIKEQGFFRFFKNLVPPGLPFWLIPIMFPIEILGLVTKTFALAIRLFANMIAGHIVILTFFGLIFLFNSFLVAPISVISNIGIALLEIFVAFLQAYIFTLLTAIFVGSAMNPEH